MEFPKVSVTLIIQILLGYLVGIAIGLVIAVYAQINPVALTAMATALLVLITAYYAWTNYRILAEMQKERKIRHIERRLEKLYCPVRLDEDATRGGFYEKLRDKLGSFQYLGSERLRKEFDAYLNACKTGDRAKNREHYQKIKGIVEEEIPLMMDELSKLSGYH